MEANKCVDYVFGHAQDLGKTFLNILWASFASNGGKFNRGMLDYKAENEWPLHFYTDDEGYPQTAFYVAKSRYKKDEYDTCRLRFIEMCKAEGLDVNIDDPDMSDDLDVRCVVHITGVSE